jgi:hypothetical protein
VFGDARYDENATTYLFWSAPAQKWCVQKVSKCLCITFHAFISPNTFVPPYKLKHSLEEHSVYQVVSESAVIYCYEVHVNGMNQKGYSSLPGKESTPGAAPEAPKPCALIVALVCGSNGAVLSTAKAISPHITPYLTGFPHKYFLLLVIRVGY